MSTSKSESDTSDFGSREIQVSVKFTSRGLTQLDYGQDSVVVSMQSGGNVWLTFNNNNKAAPWGLNPNNLISWKQYWNLNYVNAPFNVGATIVGSGNLSTKAPFGTKTILNSDGSWTYGDGSGYDMTARNQHKTQVYFMYYLPDTTINNVPNASPIIVDEIPVNNNISEFYSLYIE